MVLPPPLADLSPNQTLSLAITPQGRATLLSSSPSHISNLFTFPSLGGKPFPSPHGPGLHHRSSSSSEVFHPHAVEGLEPATPSQRVCTSPGRALLRQYTMVSPSPSPVKPLPEGPEPEEHQTKILTPGQTHLALESLLASSHLLPAGWLTVLHRLIAEGTATLAGTRKGPSTIAQLLEAGESHQRSFSLALLENSQLRTKRKRKASGVSDASETTGASKVARPFPPAALPPPLQSTNPTASMAGDWVPAPLPAPQPPAGSAANAEALKADAAWYRGEKTRLPQFPSDSMTTSFPHESLQLLPSAPIVEPPSHRRPAPPAHAPISNSTPPVSTLETSIPSSDNVLTTGKRKVGRPKGSKTKRKRGFAIYEEILPDPPKLVGEAM